MSICPYPFQMWENPDQKKLCISTLFTQCKHKKSIIYLFKVSDEETVIMSLECLLEYSSCQFEKVGNK